MDQSIDLLLINPGGREQIYQSLGTELSAVEPPPWCRLIGGYDCRPPPTKTLSTAEVLRFRNKTFDAYFGSSCYLEMVTQRFGVETRKHIEQTAGHNLSRKLLEEADCAADAAQFLFEGPVLAAQLSYA